MLNLRPATAKDIAEIKNWPPYAGGFEQMDYAVREKGWLDEFSKKPNSWVYIAGLDGQIAGFSLLNGIGGREAEFRVAVHPHRINRGLGRKITLLTLEQGFCELNLDVISLIVRKNNHPALRLYERVGFIVTGESIHSIQGSQIEFKDMKMAKTDFIRQKT